MFGVSRTGVVFQPELISIQGPNNIQMHIPKDVINDKANPLGISFTLSGFTQQFVSNDNLRNLAQDDNFRIKLDTIILKQTPRPPSAYNRLGTH